MLLNQTFVEAAAHLTGEWCRTHQKLILACDMDETLLTESEDEQHFILRPKVLYMLRNLRAFYELCLITYSTRERTDQILRLKLDPQRKLFGGRILCREDVLAGFNNKQEAFFGHLPQCKVTKGLMKLKKARPTQQVRPPAWSYVVMLDDFPAAWSNFSSCIPIRPFLISPGTIATANGRTMPKILNGECGYVLSLYRFLVKLHAAVFQTPKPANPLAQTETHAPAPTPANTTFRHPAKDDKKGLVRKPNSTAVSGLSNLTAFSALLNLKRRINSSQKFQNMCYLDPGHLFTFDGTSTAALNATNERRARSLISQSRMPINSPPGNSKNAL